MQSKEDDTIQLYDMKHGYRHKAEKKTKGRAYIYYVDSAMCITF